MNNNNLSRKRVQSNSQGKLHNVKNITMVITQLNITLQNLI